MQANKFIAILALAAAALATGSALANKPDKGRGSGGVVYVESQGLYFDTFAAASSLPPHGPFQELKTDGPNGPSTEYGPGDPGYLGGRWWVDLNGNHMMDPDDMYFLCPLLGPGFTDG
jgi:hypothetical protein